MCSGQCRQYYPIRPTIALQRVEKARGTRTFSKRGAQPPGGAFIKQAIKELKVAAMCETVQVNSLISATEEELKVSIPKLTTFYDEVSESAVLSFNRITKAEKASESSRD